MFAVGGRTGPKRRPSETRKEVAQLLDRGWSYAEIARVLKISKGTIAYHARRLGISADDSAARRYDWSEIQRAYDSGLSMRECSRRFGFCSHSWWKAVGRGAIKPRPQAMPIENLLIVGRRTNRSHLKARLLREGLKENRCERCGITEWLGKPLNMALHHVNGDGRDNRLANIRFLCPNCHAQTENYSGRALRMRRNGNG
jgi:transposase-like protein